MSSIDREIKQLLPCDGPWYARYVSADGSVEYFKVVMWANVVERVGQDSFYHVMPIVLGDGNMPMFADYCMSFEGVRLLEGETKETVSL
jgi:hypothetical protein